LTVLCIRSIPLGELPPPPPRFCFGRDELIEKAVGLAESLNPIALIGMGGIGKTYIALTVLHSERIKHRFGDNRRFIRCDQFSVSPANFLSRLSKVIGAGVENPEDLTPLRSFLSSQEMFIILDNAESILDPQGADGQEMYRVVEELSQLDTVCLCITSRITTVPPDCKCLNVPTLSMDAAHSTFYRIYDNDEQSDRIDEILTQLDFHPLSVTLLATVAHQNQWDNNGLVKEWERRQTDVLQTDHSKSLAVTIELSLASPMFQRLGPDARGLLGVVAFFPQGIDENSLDWLFPTIPDRKTIFDKFCVLSLTYRNNGFITMLAPLRDNLRPKDTKASPLLCATKDLYITRLSVTVGPDRPGFEDTRWITSEDVNVEHLLNVFTSAEPDSDETWDACNGFMGHLYWHKRRHTVLGQKIEQLPDDHRWKPRGLLELSRLFDLFGNHMEQKRLLIHALELWRERGDNYWVARTLDLLAWANRMLVLYKEGIEQAREALAIFEWLGDMEGQVECLIDLAQLLLGDRQLDAAEEAITRSVNLMEEVPEFLLCQSSRILGDIFRAKGEREKAIHQYDIAIEIGSRFNWHHQLFWTRYSLGRLFCSEDKFDDAHAHIEQAKQLAVNDEYYLGCAMEAEAWIWHRQGRLEEAVSEALCAIKIYGKLGATRDLEECTAFLQDVELSMKKRKIGPPLVKLILTVRFCKRV
jgi:tetratricopeptide (TPR) repeat protein